MLFVLAKQILKQTTHLPAELFANLLTYFASMMPVCSVQKMGASCSLISKRCSNIDNTSMNLNHKWLHIIYNCYHVSKFKFCDYLPSFFLLWNTKAYKWLLFHIKQTQNVHFSSFKAFSLRFS